jgi:hypothetical protein
MTGRDGAVEAEAEADMARDVAATIMNAGNTDHVDQFR